jgi:hypothetical protein
MRRAVVAGGALVLSGTAVVLVLLWTRTGTGVPAATTAAGVLPTDRLDLPVRQDAPRRNDAQLAPLDGGHELIGASAPTPGPVSGEGENWALIRATFARRSGDFFGARRDARACLALNPSNAICRIEVLWSYVGSHDPLGSEEDVRQCVERFPHVALCHHFDFELQLAKGNAARARETLDRFLQESDSDGGEPATLYSEARLAQLAHDCDKADQLLKRLCAAGADQACKKVPCGEVSPPP